jgi:hypothetical protein
MNQSFVGVHVARQISMWSIGASVATRCCRRRPSDRYGSDKRNKEIVTMKLVYKYALASPHENFDLIDLQMRAAHRYRNTLVEIERGRRAAVRLVEAEAGDMPAAQRALTMAIGARELADGAIKRHRARSRKRDEPQEMRDTLRAARVAERDAAKAFRELRLKIKDSPAMIAARDAIGERAKELQRSARANCGVYWGSYLLVEGAVSDSFSDTSLYNKDGHANDPAWARWTGEGSVGVQIQTATADKATKSLTVERAASGNDSRLRIVLPDERAWDRSGRTHRECENMARQAQLSIRIGSNGRDPVWGSWRMDMHRPLPVGSTIQLATVHRKRVGPYDRWHVTFTLDVPASTRASTAGTGTIAVDVGWRVMGDELRVAGWQDDTGDRGELRLSAKDLAVLRAPEAMRSARDLRFDAARLALSVWLRDHREILPDWLRVISANVHAWKAEARMVALRNRWMDARFADDEAAYDALTNWAFRARHDWAVESCARGQALRRRREKYRVWAAQLATKYDTIVIENFDKRRVAATSRDATTENETARANRVLASTSELVSCMETAARSRRAALFAVPCADTTRTCPTCGLVESRDAAAAVRLECECGARWDQDVDGAPLVLLARWRERPGDAKIVVSAREQEKTNENGEKKEGRWAKVARLRAEKVARMATAREADADGAE